MQYRVNNKILVRWALIAACMPSTLLAQQSTEVLEEIIVTSSRVPLPRRQIATSLSVLDSAAIQAHGNLQLSDVLRQLPSVAISSNGGAGKVTNLRIRGEEGFRTLTILDGMRLSDPSSVQIAPHLEHLSSSNVQRVEILRGPQGLAYGADAGGIVNISSPRAQDGLAFKINMQGGAQGTLQNNANLSAGNATGDFFLSLSDLSIDGYNSQALDSVLQDKDGYDNTTVHLRTGLNLSEDWRVELVHRDTDSNSLFDNCYSAGSYVHDCNSEFEMQASRLQLGYQGDQSSHTLAYSTTQIERDSLAQGVVAFGSKGELERWDYVGNLTELSSLDLVFGADYEKASDNTRSRNNLGVFVEYLSDFSESIYLAAGTRFDDNDDAGSNTTYRVSAAWLLDLQGAGTLKLKSSYGTGFRVPSLYEVAYNSGAFAYPPASNTTLTQESSKGWELGVEYIGADALRLEAVYFDQDVEDAIYFDLSAYSGYLQDVGKSRSRGIELSGSKALGVHWNLQANYTYNDTGRPDGRPRPRRPQNLANVGLSWHDLPSRLQAHAFLRASRNSMDELGSMDVALDDYVVMDLSASYQINTRFQLYARLENALDKQYQEVTGYNTSGRAAYLGFSYSLAKR